MKGPQVTQQVFTAENVMNYTYDNIGQLKTAQGLESGGTTPRLQEQFGYAYDKAWNLNYRTNNALIQTFNVNNLNELTQVQRSGTLTVAGTTTEPGGNVASVTVNGVSAYKYADGTFAAAGFALATQSNSYTAIAQDNSWRTDTNTVSVFLPVNDNLDYDLNGNLLRDKSPAGGTNHCFAYDDENQLVSVWVANTWSNSFTYDGLLQKRIERDYAWNGSAWAKTNEVRFIYDGYLVVQERDGNNLPQVTYTRGLDLAGNEVPLLGDTMDGFQGAGGIGGLLARTDMGQWIAGDPNANAFYHADGSGNITCLVNSNAVIVAQYQYDPFGNMTSMSGPLAGANRYRFSSKEWNDNAGLYYYGFRFYDPNLQRWLNRDPFGESIGINLYGIAFNNPIFWIDPLGLECQLSFGIAGTIGGGPIVGFFLGGGTSLGVTSSGQIFIQFQAASMLGVGDYAGVDFQGGVSHSDTPTPAGISTQTAYHGEANGAVGLGGGVSGDANSESLGAGSPTPHTKALKGGVGYGGMIGGGKSTTTTIATPPLGFPRENRSDETPPVTNINAPPNAPYIPCHCN